MLSDKLTKSKPSETIDKTLKTLYTNEDVCITVAIAVYILRNDSLSIHLLKSAKIMVN